MENSDMPHIDHPARQGENPSIADWLRYRIGVWMQGKGAALEYRSGLRAGRIPGA